MGKISKEEQWRREGMAYALKVAEQKGIDGLRQELKFRNISFAPLAIPKAKLDEFAHNVKTQTTDVFCILCEIILHDKYGFGKKRLIDFSQELNRYAEMICEDYVTVEDIVGILEEECGIRLPYRKNDRSVVIREE